METEKRLVEYICRTRYEDFPSEPLDTVKKMLLTVLGTALAGSTAEGCEALAAFYRGTGGRAEATVWVHGAKIPANEAAFVNGVMARALDFCDAMAPGLHIGSSAVPAARREVAGV